MALPAGATLGPCRIIEQLTGAFAAGRTRRLEARLGRMRKNLSLDWR